MKKILLSLLIVFVSYLNAFSSHFSGAELTYDWVQDNGNGTSDYLITLQVYRDCSGQNYQGSYIVNYFSPICNPAVQDLEVFAVGGSPDISPEANCGIPTLCSDITAFASGIQKQRYEAVVTLPHCDDYKFYWGKLGRNDLSLSNVVNLSIPGQSMYVEMGFNSTSLENEGPVLLDNIMSHKICAGEYFSFDFDSAGFSLNNPDGDSLIFEIVETKVNSSGDNLLYEAGFNSFNPIQAAGFSLSTDGLLEFTAGLAQSSIVSIKITELDDLGNEIGYVIRDMNINVVNCNNNAPEITGVDGTQEDTIYMCGGSSQCFYIYGSDIDGDDVTRSTYTVTPLGGPNRFTSPQDQYRFCFNPTQTGTWTIDLGFTDNKCPDAIESRRTITVIVPNDSVFQCNCATVEFDYDNICLGSTTNFFGEAYPGLGASVTDWEWDFAGQATSTLEDPSHTFTQPGDYDITLTMTGDNGCSKTSTTTLHICDIPNTGFEMRDSCQVAAHQKNPAIFLDTTTSDCNIFRRAWDYGDGNADPLSTSLSGSNEYLDSGLFVVQQIIEYGDPDAPTKCYDTTSREIRIYPKPIFEIHPDNFFQSCDPTFDTLYNISLADTSNLIQWFVNNDIVPDYLGGEDDTLNLNTYTLTEDSFRIRDIEIMVRAEDSLGCYEDSIRYIYDPVRPRYLNSPYCETGDTIFFWDITDTTDGRSALHYGLAERQWDFGDPSTLLDIASDSSTFYVYPSDDIYYADLYYLDNDSCYDWSARPTIKVVLPTDDFEVYASGDPSRDNDTICFNKQEVIYVGPQEDRAEINTYIWYLDDTTNVDSVIVQNLYNNNGWGITFMNNGSVVSSNTSNSSAIIYEYDPNNYGQKFIHLKMIYNTIRNDRDQLVDSLFCVRHYFDTIDIRPPQEIDIRAENRCDYQTNELTAIHLPGGDTLVDWFVDFGDECFVGCGGLVYSEADTVTGFGSVDSIYAEYQYSPFGLPDRKGIRIKEITINDVYGCEYTFTYQDTVIKLDTQVIIPLNFCDNELMFFPPNSVNNNNDQEWADDFENVVELLWDFGVIDSDSDTLLFDLTEDTRSDSVTFFYPDDTVYNVTLTAYSHQRECSTSVSKEIAIQPAPIAELDIPGISCVGSPIVFKDKSIARGVWELDGNGGFVRVPDTLTNWILYIDGDTINMADDITTVNGDTVDIGSFADGGFAYTYSSSYYDTVVLVAITDTGCLSVDSIYPVYTAPYPIANFGYETSLPGPRSEIIFTDSTDWIEDNIQHPDSAYRWILTDDEGNLELFEMGWDLEEIIYQLEKEDIFNMELIVMNEYRCSDTISKEVDSYAYLDFPTAFSPTEDGDVRNNIFRLHHKGFDELLEYRIFNRYGEVVFQGQDLDDTWDGRYKGRLQETGMYVVVVRAVDVLDREKQFKKNVLLVR